MCDETVSQDVKVCPSCSTDLTLFSAEDTQAVDMGTEDLKKSLLSSDNGHVSELLKVAAEEPAPRPIEVLQEDSVECPECGNAIPADAVKCPHCGVEFEFEEMFECPMCASVLEITVTKCPSCGAEFEDAAPESEPPAEAPKEPAPSSIPEPKPEPSSFAERLKQVKEDVGQSPAPMEAKKELSFAERMKAMKEGTLPDEPAPAAPTKSSTPAPAAGTSISDRVKTLQQGAPGPKQPPADAKAEQYKELPRHIGEVKKLLILASELKVDVSASKSVINKAVTAGKNRDMETAVRLVKEGKAGIEKEIRTTYASKVRTMESAIGLERKAGNNISDIETALAEAKKSLEINDFQTASGHLKAIENRLMKSSSSNLSQAELGAVSSAIENADSLKLNVSEARTFFEEAKKAAAQNDSQKTSQLAKQAAESLNKVLPTYIAGEMRKAKVTLREIKMMNVDITSPVRMLKDANERVSQGDYCSALGHIKSFKEFVDRVAE